MESRFKYKYETHMHDCEVSACGRTHARDYVYKYLELGYSGIIVTDHFFNGNCIMKADDITDWKSAIDFYCHGYELVKDEGDKKGLKVFFGIEDNYGCDEYLVYGIDRQWLYNHPDMLTWSRKEHYEKIHNAGGMVIQAHPYRERNYISQIKLNPYYVDGAEVSNAGNPAEQDILAYRYALKYGLHMTAGSDMHNIESQNTYFGIASEKPLATIQDYISLIKSGSLGRDYELITGQERLDLKNECKPGLPVLKYSVDCKMEKVAE